MSHERYMHLALRLAGRGRTSPNPKVGAVVVKGGEIVGRGYHPRAGEPHAEVFALEDAAELAKGATLYVTLEPCCHTGRTPPCVDAIIEAGITKVYAAMADPDPKVSGKGFDALKRAGVDVQYGLMEAQARELNEAYIKHRVTGMPLVILKAAMSLDGRIATRTGDSKWITNEQSRAFAHTIRRDVDAIVVGGATARIDNPTLIARTGRATHYPSRVVLTKSGELPSDLALFKQPGISIVATSQHANKSALRNLKQAGVRIMTVEDLPGGGCSIRHLMSQLAELGHTSTLIEGGSEVAAQALQEKIVDKVMFFYAPKIIGGRGAVGSIGGLGAEFVAGSIRVDRIKTRRFGDDLMITGYVVYPLDSD